MTVRKEVVNPAGDPDAAREFTFTPDPTAPWLPANEQSFQLVHDTERTTCTDSTTADYTVTETTDPLYNTTSACTGDIVGPQGERISSASGSSVTFRPGPTQGEILLCTFTNTRKTADLALTKTDPPGRQPTGRDMTYTLTVTNNGPDAASDVVVTDTLPPSVTFVDAGFGDPLPVGYCDPPSGGVVTCYLGPIASGGSRSVLIRVKPTQAGMITNSASVASPTPDPNQGNNADSEDTSICRITSRRSSIPCG